jgi:hypothetical protein
MHLARTVALVSLAACQAITGLDDLGLREDASASVAASTATSGSGGAGAGGTAGMGGAGATAATGGTAGAGGSPCDAGGTLTYAQTVLCDEPAAYWRFEELDPPDAMDEMGLHPAQYVGTMTLGADGIAGSRAATFHANGQGYVLVGDVFDFVGTSEFTLEAWVKPVGPVPDYAALFGKFFDEGGEEQGYVLSLIPSGLNAARTRDGVADGLTVGELAVDELTHVALTYDGLTLSIFENGVLAKGTESTAALVDRDTPLTIGSWHGWGYFNGVIDEVAIYDKLLKSTRILAHYQAGTADRDP